MLWLTTIFLFLLSSELVISNNGQPPDFLDNIGAQVSADVHKFLAPIQNLKSKIEQQVQNSVRFKDGNTWNPTHTDWVLGTSDLSNLEKKIRKRVEENLKPVYEMIDMLDMENAGGDKKPIGQPLDLNLDNLSAQISADVQRYLAPLNNLEKNVQQHNEQDSVETSVKASAEASIEASVETTDDLTNIFERPPTQSLTPSPTPRPTNTDQRVGKPKPSVGKPKPSKLGDQIRKQVDKGLKPIYEMQVRLDMESGEGGNTVVTFKPSGKTLIVKDGKAFNCHGEISEYGVCSTNLELFKFKSKFDKCFHYSSLIIINGYICQSPDGTGSVSAIQDSKGLTCRDSKGEKIKPISVKEYERQCKSVAEEVSYTYVTYKKISRNKPKYIKCSGSSPTVCKFSKKMEFSR